MAVNIVRGGDQPPQQAELRLVDSGRIGIAADLWRRPLPPTLWRRLAQKVRREHERLVDRYQRLGLETATLAGKVEIARAPVSGSHIYSANRSRASLAPVSAAH